MGFVIEKTTAFAAWLEKQSPKFRALVESRLNRIVESAHFGTAKNLGQGLAELKFKNGYRIYFVKLDVKKILLVLGGHKNAQKKDIKRARKFFF